MPSLKDAPVPEYENEETNAISQKTEFTDDVFVYGNLYADITGEDIIFDDNTTFGSVTIEDNLFVSGLSTFWGPVDMQYLTVYQRLDVGAGGTVLTAISTTNGYNGDGQTGGRVGIGSTQPDARFQVGVGDTSFVVTDLGLVGIGTTQPDGKFQVGDECFTIADDCTATFIGSVGVGTTQPISQFQVGLGQTQSFIVNNVGQTGIGTSAIAGDWTVGNAQYQESNEGRLQLDVDGSVHISRNIYDSAGSPGANGFFMNRDANGIRWVSFEPSMTEGIFLQDEGVYIPTVGAAQSFTVLNFVQLNSGGTGTDTLIPTAQSDTTPTGLSTIFTKDLWGYVGSGDNASIYRLSKVGINNSNPSTTLDISGTVHASGDVDFDSILNVDGAQQYKRH